VTDWIKKDEDLNSRLAETELRLSRLEDLQKIFRLWLRLREKHWPSNCNSLDIHGINLVVLDSDIAGCVSWFLHNESLDQARLESLYYSNDALDIVNLELQHGFESWWFKQLKALTSSIIEFQHKWNNDGPDKNITD
jgi:hypothetical protein